MTQAFRYLVYLGLLGTMVCWVVLFGPAPDADSAPVTTPIAAAPVAPNANARGQYLVERVCLCADCHTPHTPAGESDRARSLQGAPLGFKPLAPMPNWSPMAPPLAGGYPGWSPAQLAAFMETGKTPQGAPARPPMPAYRLTHEDAAVLAAWLHSLPAPGQ